MEIQGSNILHARESSDHASTRASAYRLPPTAYGLRPTAYRLRPAAYGLRPAAYGLRSTACGLPPTGFTLIEMLVVMAIIVLVILMAIPAIQSITGTRSVGAAQNTLAALITRAREEAVGLQEIRGVMFYIDPATDGVDAALVHQVSAPTPDPNNPSPAVYLDAVPSRDFMAFPKGIGAQTLINAILSQPPGGVYTTDAYLGFNPPPGTSTRVGGVILFDGNGKLVSLTYGLKLNNSINPAIPTLMATLLGITGNPLDYPCPPPANYPVPVNAVRLLTSQVGLVLYDRQTFLSQGFSDGDTGLDTNVTSYGSYSGAGTGEGVEESWLDKNATPILINRYNGTLIRGE